ncbi:MAG TPA: hypothetical protein VFN74_12675 [Chloroflexota bacterium]|nr:hypothetical protein [Chloroflexota bacterium]
MPEVTVRAGASYKLPGVEFESRTTEITLTNTAAGIPDDEVARDLSFTVGRMMYLAERDVLRVLVAKGRYTVAEAKETLTRIAKSYQLVELSPEEAAKYLDTPEVYLARIPATSGPVTNGATSSSRVLHAEEGEEGNGADPHSEGRLARPA